MLITGRSKAPIGVSSDSLLLGPRKTLSCETSTSYSNDLYSIRRTVDSLVHIKMTSGYEQLPIVTANTILTLPEETSVG